MVHIVVSEAEARDIVAHSHTVVLIFTAAHCGPSQVLVELLREESSRRLPIRVRVVFVDVASCGRFADEHEVAVTPVALGFLDGVVKYRMEGAIPATLIRICESLSLCDEASQMSGRARGPMKTFDMLADLTDPAGDVSDLSAILLAIAKDIDPQSRLLCENVETDDHLYNRWRLSIKGVEVKCDLHFKRHKEHYQSLRIQNSREFEERFHERIASLEAKRVEEKLVKLEAADTTAKKEVNLPKVTTVKKEE
ncbi:Thioredoxin [Carpediemonas membranifera]|uniref:Thioredoxin n=1 Tax=Carpediemonas membranifera TaxID=201153 RepID=A0A8J6E0C7_9EUKA|nr:Thioredoxin [Carpediemonas membranifera]|eukprot:KAG9394929.1 Thioredoxin [Carpediemonas membranifera]